MFLLLFWQAGVFVWTGPVSDRTTSIPSERRVTLVDPR